MYTTGATCTESLLLPFLLLFSMWLCLHGFDSRYGPALPVSLQAYAAGAASLLAQYLGYGISPSFSHAQCVHNVCAGMT